MATKTKSKTAPKATGGAVVKLDTLEIDGVQLTAEYPAMLIVHPDVARAMGVDADGDDALCIPIPVATSDNPQSGLRVSESKGVRYLNADQGLRGMLPIPAAGVDIKLGMRKLKAPAPTAGKGSNGTILFG